MADCLPAPPGRTSNPGRSGPGGFEERYYRGMVRGWDSKSVESQIEDAASRPRSHKHPMPPEEMERRRKIDRLRLSRVRVVHDLEQARHIRHRAQLEAALAHLDREIASLGAVVSIEEPRRRGTGRTA